ncbi:cytidylyltransferase domain-containing protein [Sandaracinus amylolyticus]|uniref:acylneuraminate cytidylyltransferase family protein n=1 Tax=Sandaracinus amylolyticus TaxID=927083 RepID=UPI001F2DFB2F|nr:acylneuraminate cytidylyltransferase family protein [Sandaracinus amylolyticus]UJR80415.1 N-Acetylneuraminate cytidylyltransferase [Sandaracinus amylolyticus]
MSAQRRFAIIPARGGSKRIPRKNVVELEGKPLISWTIDAARECGLFDRIIVSTDDEEIAEISRRSGAEVPFLREAYADDHSPVSLATVSAIERLAAEGLECDVVVQLFAACPLRNAADIRDGVEHFERSGARFQISCFDLGWAHAWWAVRLDAEGRPAPLFPSERLKRSQDLESIYCPTGATWIARTEALLEARTFYGPDHRFHAMPWHRAVDIDEPEDLRMASALYRAYGPLETTRA